VLYVEYYCLIRKVGCEKLNSENLKIELADMGLMDLHR
jgi:hypothetical protein